jgi:hypothetical protein
MSRSCKKKLEGLGVLSSRKWFGHASYIKNRGKNQWLHAAEELFLWGHGGLMSETVRVEHNPLRSNQHLHREQSPEEGCGLEYATTMTPQWRGKGRRQRHKEGSSISDEEE